MIIFITILRLFLLICTNIMVQINKNFKKILRDAESPTNHYNLTRKIDRTILGYYLG